MKPWDINTADMKGDASLIPWFWEKIRPRLTHYAPTGCWKYEGWSNGNGYRKIRLKGDTLYVHRIVYCIFVRKVVKLEIDHVCVNRWCCNPNHLRAVHRRTNMRLMAKRLKKRRKN